MRKIHVTKTEEEYRIYRMFWLFGYFIGSAEIKKEEEEETVFLYMPECWQKYQEEIAELVLQCREKAKEWE